jgi:hypothetical protein
MINQFLLGLVLLLIAVAAPLIARDAFLRRRHHDHLIPGTPRSARAR